MCGWRHVVKDHSVIANLQEGKLEDGMHTPFTDVDCKGLRSGNQYQGQAHLVIQMIKYI